MGNRKDIRNAVEAARSGVGLGAATAHNRAQMLYYLAENLAARADEFAARLASHDGRVEARAPRPRSTPSIRALLRSMPPGPTSIDGAVHSTPLAAS